MFPDMSQYTWIVPDFVWELSENIDLGKEFVESYSDQTCLTCAYAAVAHYLVVLTFWLYAVNVISVSPNKDKLARALPELEELAKLLPDMEKIGENFTFLKSLLSSGKQCPLNTPHEGHKLNTGY